MRLVLFTGKGGVGKTTTAAATAVHAWRSGLRVLVVSTDPAHSLGDALGVPVGHAVTSVGEGLAARHLGAPSRANSAWEPVRERLAPVLDDLGVDPLEVSDLTALPAAEELLALLEVNRHLRSGEWDVVLVDCAATAQTLRLLALPDVLRRVVGHLLPLERRVARALERTPAGPGEAGDPVRDLLAETADDVLPALVAVQDMLRDDGTSVRLVVTPESVVAAESRRTWTALALNGFAVEQVVANRVVPAGGDDPWRAAWNRSQQQVLERVRSDFAPAPVVTAGYAAGEPVGLEALAALGTEMHGPPGPEAARRLLDPPVHPAGVHVGRDGTDFVLDLDLPLAARGEVDLSRRGAELLVGVGSSRRVVDLPSALQRCDVVGARLRDGRLSVRFTPDPDLWRAF